MGNVADQDGSSKSPATGQPVAAGALPPEFLNRVDEIVIFHPLSKQDLVQIVDIQLERVAALLSQRGSLCRWTRGAPLPG